jgi:hypothetical protein
MRKDRKNLKLYFIAEAAKILKMTRAGVHAAILHCS